MNRGGLMTRPETLRPIPQERAKLEASARPDVERDEYVVPLLHTRIPERTVDIAFWGSLGVASLFGVVDPPLALLIGAGVLVARHNMRHSESDGKSAIAPTAAEPD
jgi:hypothetical protein